MSHFSLASMWDDTDRAVRERYDEEDRFLDDDDATDRHRRLYKDYRDDQESDEDEDDGDGEPTPEELAELETQVSRLGPLNHVEGEDDDDGVAAKKAAVVTPASAPPKPAPVLVAVAPRPVAKEVSAPLAEFEEATRNLAIATERHRKAKEALIRHISKTRSCSLR